MGRAAAIYWAVMLCILSQVIKLCRWLYFSRLKSFILSDISTLFLCSSSWVSKLLKTCSACVFIFLVAILFVYSTLWGIWLISVLFGEHLCVIRGTPPRPSAGVVLGLGVQQLRSFLKACRVLWGALTPYTPAPLGSCHGNQITTRTFQNYTHAIKSTE